MYAMTSQMVLGLVLTFALTGIGSAATGVAGSLPKLSPRVAAVYRAAESGNLKTADKNGSPVRQPFGPRFNKRSLVEVDIYYPAGVFPDLRALDAMGFVTESQIKALHNVEGYIRPDELGALASMPWVTKVTFPRYAGVNGGSTASGYSPTDINAAALDLEGVAAARQALKATGAGVKVLVISDGAEHWRDYAAAGALPTDLWIDPNVSGASGDEGSWMLEIVHSIAPDSSLGFCPVATGNDLLTCLNDAASTFHANIIVSDIFIIGVSGFEYGPYLQSVQNFMLSHPSIAVINAVGNRAQHYFKGTYAPSSSAVTVGGTSAPSAEDWGVATGGISDTSNRYVVGAGDSMNLVLEWDDPWNSASHDYGLYLTDDSGNVLATGVQQGSSPASTLSFTNSSNADVATNIVVTCKSATCNNTFFVAAYTHDLTKAFEYATADGSATPLASLRNIVTVGAVDASAPDSLEAFSAHGPYTIEYPSSDAISNPDMVAGDNVLVMGYDNGPSYQMFYGTSAAAPQVAGILALLQSGSTRGNAQTLMNTAVDLGDDGYDYDYGWGRIDAASAAAVLLNDTAPTVQTLDAISVKYNGAYDGSLHASLSDAGAKAGLTLTYLVTTKPAHGTLTLDSKTGAFTYTPDSNYSGDDSFQYAASDGLMQSDAQTAQLHVESASAPDPQPGPDPAGPSQSSGGGGSFGLLGLLLLGLGLGKAVRDEGDRPL